MLQRIQSLLLLAAILFTLLYIFLPVAIVEAGGHATQITPLIVLPGAGATIISEKPFLGWVSLISAMFGVTLSFITIFRFKYRLLQISYGKVNIFIHMVLVVTAFWHLEHFKEIPGSTFQYGYAVVFPLISMILILMANRAIRKDENLVRSADRLR